MARIIFLEIVCLDEVRVIIVAYQRLTNSGPVTTATLPYFRGTSETIARILQPYNIRVAHKPITTLRGLLTNVRQRQTGGQTGSSIQDQMLRLPGFLHW